MNKNKSFWVFPLSHTINENLWAMPKINDKSWNKKEKKHTKKDVWRLSRDIFFGEEVKKLIKLWYLDLPKRVKNLIETNDSCIQNMWFLMKFVKIYIYV